MDIKNNFEISQGHNINDSKDSLEQMFTVIYDKLNEIIESIKTSKEETEKNLHIFDRRKTQEIVREITELSPAMKKKEKNAERDNLENSENLENSRK